MALKIKRFFGKNTVSSYERLRSSNSQLRSSNSGFNKINDLGDPLLNLITADIWRGCSIYAAMRLPRLWRGGTSRKEKGSKGRAYILGAGGAGSGCDGL